MRVTHCNWRSCEGESMPPFAAGLSFRLVRMFPVIQGVPLRAVHHFSGRDAEGPAESSGSELAKFTGSKFTGSLSEG
jgi:hypothetical protein